MQNYIFDKISELRNSVFLFSFSQSKVSELRKINYDVTIWFNSVLWGHNP